jgi:tetratricopeptide (TPR) repeat protein
MVLAWPLFARSFARFHPCDLGVLSLSIVYGLWLFPDNQAIGVAAVAGVYRGIAIYYLVRTAYHPQLALRRLTLFIGTLAGIVSLFFIENTTHWVNSVLQAGFTDPGLFKNLLRTPLNIPINEWATVVLVSLVTQVTASQLTSNWKSFTTIICGAAAFCTLCAISLSLSRGTYLAFGGFVFLLLCIGLRQKSLRLIVTTAVLLLIALLSGLAMNSLTHGAVARAAGLAATEQQIRSTWARVDVWSNSLGLAKKHWFVGVGPRRFAMRYLPVAQLGEGRNFPGRPLNAGLTILIELGIAGLLPYGVIFLSAVAPGFQLLRRKRVSGIGPAAALSAGLCALAMREATFSSLTENQTVSAMFWLIAGASVTLGHRLRPSAVTTAAPFPARLALGMAAVCIASSFVMQHRSERAERLAARAAVHLNSGDFGTAALLLNQAVQITPSPYYSGLRALALAAPDISFSGPQHLTDILKVPINQERLRSAFETSEEALKHNPDDDAFIFNRGWIRFRLGGSRAELLGEVRRAVEVDGSSAPYHVALGLLHEQNGSIVSAIEAYANALAASPQVADSRFGIDLKQRNRSAWEASVLKAIDCLQRRDPEGRNLVNAAKLAKLYIERQQTQIGRDLLRQVTSRMPELARPWANLAHLDYMAGDLSSSEAAIRKARYLDPDFCPVADLLRRIARSKGDEVMTSRSDERCTAGNSRVMSTHAARIGTVYRPDGPPVFDDILPYGILRYCEPLSFFREEH